MKSNICGRNYVVQDEYGNIDKFNKKAFDTSVGKIVKALETVNEELENLWNSHSGGYYLVREVMDGASMDVEEGKCWRLRYTKDELEDLLEQFQTRSDEIKTPEEVMTLRDYGFTKSWESYHSEGKEYWDKTLRDDDEFEVVEEIIIYKERASIRRQRTTEWEDVPGGRHSKSIKYKTLPIGKRLGMAIENTIADGLPEDE